MKSLERLLEISNPRGLIVVGNFVYVLARTSGAISRFDLMGKDLTVERFWRGDDAYVGGSGPFVGPAYHGPTRTLWVSALGRDLAGVPPRAPSALYAIPLDRTPNSIRPIFTPRSESERTFFDGPAGLVSLGKNGIAVSSFWGKRKLLFGEDGHLERVLLDLSAAQPKYGGPDGLATDASGRLCVCDRTRRSLWVLDGLASDKPAREIYTRLPLEPIAASFDEDGSLLVIEKVDATINRFVLADGEVRPGDPTIARGATGQQGKGIVTVSWRGKRLILVAVGKDGPQPDDGIYRVK